MTLKNLFVDIPLAMGMRILLSHSKLELLAWSNTMTFVKTLMLNFSTMTMLERTCHKPRAQQYWEFCIGWLLTIFFRKVYSDDESRVLFNALRLVKHIIKTKRILLKLPFQDFDRTNNSHVTREQFGRVLVNVGIQLDQPTIDILARKYMDKG